jgi:hypothetical protein
MALGSIIPLLPERSRLAHGSLHRLMQLAKQVFGGLTGRSLDNQALHYCLLLFEALARLIDLLVGLVETQ